MNSRIVIIVAALAAAATWFATPLASAALGRDTDHLRPPAAADRGDQGQAFSLNGRIESVDYTANVIVVREKGHQGVAVALTPTTAVEEQGQAGSIADLRPGMHVRVRGSVRNGSLVAETIVVK